MSNRAFDLYIAVDWSARNAQSPARPSKDAIWVGVKDLINKTQQEYYFRTRFSCLNFLVELLINSVSEKKRVIIGYDLDFGFPAGFVDALGLQGDSPKWKRMWDKLNGLITDNEFNENNRFEVADQLNQLCMPSGAIERGPLWGHPINLKFDNLYYKGTTYPFLTKSGHSLRKSRWTEERESKAQPVWKLIGTASVGGQTLVGIPAVRSLRFHENLGHVSTIWPFETGFQQPETEVGEPLVLHVEIWPGILSSLLDSSIEIRDQAQVRATVDWMAFSDEDSSLRTLLSRPDNLTDDQVKNCIEEEGWVLGSGTRTVKSVNPQYSLESMQ